jgi:hypothetical protein
MSSQYVSVASYFIASDDRLSSLNRHRARLMTRRSERRHIKPRICDSHGLTVVRPSCPEPSRGPSCLAWSPAPLNKPPHFEIRHHNIPSKLLEKLHGCMSTYHISKYPLCYSLAFFSVSHIAIPIASAVFVLTSSQYLKYNATRCLVANVNIDLLIQHPKNPPARYHESASECITFARSRTTYSREVPDARGLPLSQYSKMLSACRTAISNRRVPITSPYLKITLLFSVFDGGGDATQLPGRYSRYTDQPPSSTKYETVQIQKIPGVTITVILWWLSPIALKPLRGSCGVLQCLAEALCRSADHRILQYTILQQLF